MLLLTARRTLQYFTNPIISVISFLDEIFNVLWKVTVYLVHGRHLYLGYRNIWGIFCIIGWEILQPGNLNGPTRQFCSSVRVAVDSIFFVSDELLSVQGVWIRLFSSTDEQTLLHAWLVFFGGFNFGWADVWTTLLKIDFSSVFARKSSLPYWRAFNC